MHKTKNLSAAPADKVDEPRYAKLQYDTAWKRCFASEENKELLLLLLQNLFPDKNIVSINLAQGEHVNPFPDHRDNRTDVEAVDSQGRRFVVELQLKGPRSFNDRLVYYSSFAMQQQILKGNLERAHRDALHKKNRNDIYDFPPVYIISLLCFSHHKDSKVLRWYKVADPEDGTVFSEKLNFISIDMTLGMKTGLKKDASFAEQLSYAILKMPDLKEQPKELSGKFFDMLFNCAEITNFTAAEKINYERNKMEAEVQAAYEEEIRQDALAEGEAIGREKNAKDIAKGMLAKGMDVALISELTKLSVEELNALKEALKLN